MTKPPQKAPFGVPIDHGLNRYQSVPIGGYMTQLRSLVQVTIGDWRDVLARGRDRGARGHG